MGLRPEAGPPRREGMLLVAEVREAAVSRGEAVAQADVVVVAAWAGTLEAAGAKEKEVLSIGRC